MEIVLNRTAKLPKCTLGELSIDGVHSCYTVEDTVREIAGQSPDKWKIPHVTAIPVGRYEVVVTMSNRFKKLLPELLNVPGFDGIRIHTGNTAEDTDGCLIVGETLLPAGVGSSKLAFDDLFPKIQSAVSKGEKVWITIK
jgi:hypothetical protein